MEPFLATEKDMPPTITAWELGRFDGRQFVWFTPRSINDLGWVSEGNTLQRRNGEWWVGTAHGIYRFFPATRFDQIRNARPRAVYTAKDGLGDNPPFRLFEDSHGNVWVSLMSGNSLLLWQPESGTFKNMSTLHGFPSEDGLARSFAEDNAGNVWIGFNGQLTRYNHERVDQFGTGDGVPDGGISSLYVDHSGQVWFTSTRGGLVRIENPDSSRPHFRSYTTSEGLSTNSTEAFADHLIVEDEQGYIYVGTGRGLDRLNPVTGLFRHFTTADGLASGSFRSCFRDGEGRLWFGLTRGLSRLRPTSEEAPEAPPAIFISNLLVGRSRRFVSALGETEIVVPDLNVDQSRLQVNFLGLSFAPGELLQYQHKLEGAEIDWSALSGQRAVEYANLAPGRYRFLVRAVNADGVASTNPAVIRFRILPPIWERWWFLTLAAGLMTLVLYRLYRYRLAQLLEIERVRTRIASDLHDDIGANLSLIAGLSDVLRQQARSSDVHMAERLTLIADVSRRSVDAMSDIVWAVNPSRDRLSDLSQRMRRFATETLGTRGIDFRLAVPDAERDIRISADVRRELYLIFKEGVNNIARHSQCSLAELALQNEGDRISLTISDNGKGFVMESADRGQGLTSIERRAKRAGAQLFVITSPGLGTTLAGESFSHQAPAL